MHSTDRRQAGGRRSGLTSRAQLRGALAAVALGQAGCRQAPHPPEIWEREPDLYRPHPRLWVAHKPDASRRVDFPEHPAGGFEMRTETHGFREDGAVAGQAPGRRVLLVGDSHLAGVVANQETVASVLQTRLQLDVVNGATGYWGPDQYAAFFAEWVGPEAASQDLQPAACIAVIYLGNDFLDTLAHGERGGELRLPRPPEHGARLVAAWEQGGEVVSQLLNQDAVLALRPDLAQTAVERTARAMLQARKTCGERWFGVALLPPRLDVDARAEAPTGKARAALGLAPAEVGRHRALATVLRTQLEAEGVPVLELQPALAAAHDEARPAYWQTDWHLAVQGHAAVAGAIAAAWGAELRGG